MPVIACLIHHVCLLTVLRVSATSWRCTPSEVREGELADVPFCNAASVDARGPAFSLSARRGPYSGRSRLRASPRLSGLSLRRSRPWRPTSFATSPGRLTYRTLWTCWKRVGLSAFLEGWQEDDVALSQ